MDTTNKCWHCGRGIDGEDAYCRYCGRGQGPKTPFRYTHGGIIVLSLLIGPLALPFILKSPKIGGKSRMAYVALNLLLAFFTVSMVISTINSVNRQVKETLKIIGQTGIGIDK